MANYIGQKCPVCSQEFKQGDDIVTCPVCGTPSHRSCYEKLGGCINSSKHADGFEYKPEPTVKEEVNTASPDVQNVQGQQAQPDAKGTFNTTPVMPMSPLFTMQMNAAPNLDIPKKLAQEKVDGVTFAEIGQVVRKGYFSYIEKFRKIVKRKNKASFNFAAMIFGPYWYFYRRMSRLGAIFLGAELLISTVITVIFASQQEAFSAAVMPLMDSLSSAAITSEQFTKSFYDYFYSTGYYMAIIINFASIAVFRIVSSFFANNNYLNNCINVIKKVKSQLGDEEFVMRLGQAGYPVKSKQALYNLFINQYSGTSLLGVLTGFCGYYMLTAIIGTFL